LQKLKKYIWTDDEVKRSIELKSQYQTNRHINFATEKMNLENQLLVAKENNDEATIEKSTTTITTLRRINFSKSITTKKFYVKNNRIITINK